MMCKCTSLSRPATFDVTRKEKEIKRWKLKDTPVKLNSGCRNQSKCGAEQTTYPSVLKPADKRETRKYTIIQHAPSKSGPSQFAIHRNLERTRTMN